MQKDTKRNFALDALRVLAYYLRTYASERKNWNLPVGIALLVVSYSITWYGFHERLSTAEYVPQLEITWGYETINVAMAATGISLLIKNIQIKIPVIAICTFITSYLVIKALSCLPKSKYIIG